MRKLSYVILTALALAAPSVMAAQLRVKASLDSARILMGRMATLRLEVVEPENARGTFPVLGGPVPAGVVGVCGDSVELRTSIERDTVRLGSGKIQVNWNIPVQSFDSGLYRLPEFVYVSGGDSARSNSVVLKVDPVHATAEDPIAGLAQTVAPAGSSFWDFLPDWLYYRWWLLLTGLLAVGAGIWVLRRRRPAEAVSVRSVKVTDPYEDARTKLEELKGRKLWETGQEKEYFTELTEILRVYLQRRFGINAMEMTSRQIMSALADRTDVRDKRPYMRRILDMADFVKFAKVRPLPDDNVAAWNSAMAFVEETKPVPVLHEVPADMDTDKRAAADAGGKGGES